MFARKIRQYFFFGLNIKSLWIRLQFINNNWNNTSNFFVFPFLPFQHRVSVLTWAVPIWRVWVENFARHSTSPHWRSESAAPQGTTLPRNPPDCQHTRNCRLLQKPPGKLRSPWPDCPAPNQYEKALLSTFSSNSQSHTALLNGVNWLDDSWIVIPSLFFLSFFNLLY